MTSAPAAVTPSACVIFTTAASLEEAQRLAHSLIEARLAACVQMLPPMTSIYRWQGQIEQSSEVLMLLKTTRERLPQLEARLHELHSYEVPELLILDATASQAYATWLHQCVAPASKG
uniref:Divalent-cation tolerance protein CutA n=1 Tax=Acidobacterium capsulatum TaxID=33075 RepID=A0A7V4XUZ5_9BACT